MRLTFGSPHTPRRHQYSRCAVLLDLGSLRMRLTVHSCLSVAPVRSLRGRRHIFTPVAEALVRSLSSSYTDKVFDTASTLKPPGVHGFRFRAPRLLVMDRKPSTHISVLLLAEYKVFRCVRVVYGPASHSCHPSQHLPRPMLALLVPHPVLIIYSLQPREATTSGIMSLPSRSPCPHSLPTHRGRLPF